MLKILQVHNGYYSGTGGEANVLEEECRLLRRHGHTVEQLFVTTGEQDIGTLARRSRTGLLAVWSPSGYRLMRDTLAHHRPDLVHVNKTVPLLSPSIYWAADRAGIPLVQTLHNFRFTCANALLMRDGQPCQLCVDHGSWPGLRHRCYKDSLAATIPLAAMQTINRRIGSYTRKVTAYIVLSEFAKQIMARSGLPQEKMFVKPNFLRDALDDRKLSFAREKQIVYVGRLVPEKGVDLLLDAWAGLRADGYRLVMIGDGPLRQEQQRRTAADPSVVWLGWQAREEVLFQVARSRCLVLPSRCYEGMPLTVVEALALGTPAIVPNRGALPEMVGAGTAGFVFAGGQVTALQSVLKAAMELNGTDWRRQAECARDLYLARYTPEANYCTLMSIYESALYGRSSSPLSDVTES